MLSFIGCETELETKHRIVISPNQKVETHTENVNDIPVEQGMLTDVSDDSMPENDGDQELFDALILKAKEFIGKQWPIHRDKIKELLLLSVLVLGGCILLLHWFIRLIDRWISPVLKLGTTFIVMLFVMVSVILIVFFV